MQKDALKFESKVTFIDFETCTKIFAFGCPNLVYHEFMLVLETLNDLNWIILLVQMKVLKCGALCNIVLKDFLHSELLLSLPQAKELSNLDLFKSLLFLAQVIEVELELDLDLNFEPNWRVGTELKIVAQKDVDRLENKILFDEDVDDADKIKDQLEKDITRFSPLPTWNWSVLW